MYKICYYECKVECEQIIPGKPVFDEGQTQNLNVVRGEHTYTHTCIKGTQSGKGRQVEHEVHTLYK